MKTIPTFLFAAFAALILAQAADQATEIDWQRAQQLYRRSQRGETLTAEEQAYLDRAKALRAKQQPGQQPAAGGNIDFNKAREIMQKHQRGETVTPEERAYVERAMAARRQQGGQGKGAAAPTGPAPGGKDFVGLTPLTELGTDKYKGQDGGLYGGGKNDPPPEHAAAAKKELAKIRPLDADGQPAADGKVVLLSVGMSNTTQEFSVFKQIADADAQKSPNLVIVDGAQGGQTAARWAESPDNNVWRTVDERMKKAGVTPQQVQVAWIKQANARPIEPFPEHARKLQADVATVLNLLKKKFPNLRVAYLSSRIYAGYATTPLNPEPYAYETAFAMRWLILDQIKGEPKLNYDPARGEVCAPLLLWGPYLWADGTKARKDGLTWTRDDLTPHDGTHPSNAGRQKVASLLLGFFKSDPLARTWFLAKP